MSPLNIESIENDFFRRLLDMLEQQLGSKTEIVLHDLQKEYDRTIIDIRNGHVTGRKVGGFGSNLGLEVLKGTSENGDKYNYITRLDDGRILRSSSLYFRNEKDEIIGALCINTDISESMQFESWLREFNRYNDSGDVKEVFVQEVGQLLDHLISQAREQVGKGPEEMNREERQDFLRYLDGKGAFLINKSSERVMEYLGISKYTFYNYLDAVRTEEGLLKAGR